MRILLITAFMIGFVHSAAAVEILTEAKVLEVDRIKLKELNAGGTPSFIVNVSDGVARPLLEGTVSRTLQSFQLTTVDERPVQFRVFSRLGSLDIGIDFELTARMSVKREIKIIVTSQTEVKHRENDADPSRPVFTGEPVRHEITTAEGASVLVAGLLTERESKQLASMEDLKDSPILKSLFSENAQSKLVLILTPHIVHAPTIADVTVKVAPPTAASQDKYSVQVGAFQDRANASALLAELRKRRQDVFIQAPSADTPFYRVRVGLLTNVQEAEKLEKLLRSEGFNPFVSQIKEGVSEKTF